MSSSVRLPIVIVPYVPGIMLFFHMIFMQTPLPFVPSVMWPDMALLCVLFWSLYHPEFLPPWLLFMSGVFSDAITGAPLGITACVWLVAQRVLIVPLAGKIAHETIVLQWLVVLLILAPLWLLLWGLHSFAQRVWLPPADFLIGCIYAALAYPPLHMAFSSVLRRFPRIVSRRGQFSSTTNRDRG